MGTTIVRASLRAEHPPTQADEELRIRAIVANAVPTMAGVYLDKVAKHLYKSICLGIRTPEHYELKAAAEALELFP